MRLPCCEAKVFSPSSPFERAEEAKTSEVLGWNVYVCLVFV
jgi:hypothetical protein